MTEYEELKKGLHCPKCKSKNLVESSERLTDYYVVGDTFRCLDCKFGFGFLLEPSDDFQMKDSEGNWVKSEEEEKKRKERLKKKIEELEIRRNSLG